MTAAMPRTSDPSRPRLDGVPVLLVDDDAPSNKLLAVVFRGEGCVVEMAASAEAAVAALRRFHPRVILVDLVLPLMSGLLLAQRLKAEPATRDIVLIAVTAFDGPEAEGLALDAGFAAYVRKPVDPLALADLVSAHLGGAS
jgi:CheY-like chemotaxis protein